MKNEKKKNIYSLTVFVEFNYQNRILKFMRIGHRRKGHRHERIIFYFTKKNLIRVNKIILLL